MFKILTIISLLFTTSLFSKELEKVSLQLQWLDQFQFAGYYVAQEKGFYKDVGLDVEIKKYNNQIPVEEVTNKKATYGVGRSTLIINKSEGSNIKLLAAIFQSSPSVYITTKKSKINTIKDFNDKKIMITDDASTSVPFLVIAKRENIDIDKMNFIKHSFHIDDLINQKTDIYSAYISNEPFLFKQKGVEINTFSAAEFGFDFYDDILFTSDDEIKNHKQRAINFTKASLKGWEYAFSHIEEVVELIFNKYNPQKKSKEALLFEAKELKKLAYVGSNKLGQIDTKNIKKIYDIYDVFGYIKNHINLDGFIFQNDVVQSLQFTQEEQEYIKNKKILKVCTNIHQYPFVIIDKDNYRGISIDYLTTFSKKTDFQFEFIPAKNLKSYEALIEEGKCDFASLIIAKPNKFKFLTPTKPYAADSVVFVTNINEPYIDNLNSIKDKKIAILKGGINLIQYVKSIYPDIQLVEVDDIDLSRVASGEFYAHIGVSYQLSFDIATKYFHKLKIMDKIGDKELYGSFGIPNNNPLLLSIFNKLIDDIPNEEKNKITSNWLSVKVEKHFDYTLFIQLITGSLIIIGVLSFFYFKQKKLNKKLQNTTKELQASYEMLNKLASNIPGFLCQYKIHPDGHTSMPYVSKEVVEILEFEHKDVIQDAQPMWDIIHPDDIDMVSTSIQASIEKMDVWNIQYRVNLPKKGLRWIEGYAKPERLEDGCIIAYGYLHDITDAKRKDELLSIQSRHAAMGEMIGMIAHQWRQPLSVISMDMNNMLIDIALGDFNEEEAKNHANSILNQTQNLSKTIDDFRNFFKPDKSRIPVKIKDILEDTFSIIKNSLTNNNIELQTTFESDSQIDAYPRELMQVFVNIINNAKDALLLNKINNAVIEIKVYEDDNQVFIDIFDNAAGIDKKILPQIFDPYFSTKDDKNGTGLGLYMSKIIIEDHLSGKIEAIRIDNRTCFRVILKK